MSKKTAANAIKATDVVKQANKLSEERKHFETTILARTNEALYKLLADVYALYKEASKNDDCLNESVASMRKKLKARNIVTQSNTPKITVFVRYVFNSDRKRSYNYTQTLLAAIDENVAPKDLPDFINSKSGVEEIKRTRNVSEEKAKRKEDVESAIPVVKSQLESMPAAVTVELSNSSVALSDGTKYAFIVARMKSGDEMELLKVVPKTTVALENIAFKALAVQAVESEATDTVVVKGQAKDIAVKEAAKSLTKTEKVAA